MLSKFSKPVKLFIPVIILLAVASLWLFVRSGSYTYRYGTAIGSSKEMQVKGVKNGFVVEPVSAEFGIIIPKIGVNAPIKKDVDGALERAVAPQVLKGVGHYRRGPLGDATVDGDLPGGEPGNIFLFGHSQILGRDREENYAGVFDDLEELEKDDLVEIYFQGEKHEYRVISGQTVSKDELHWVEHTDEEVLTLMSCWPLGLDWKRYVVRAEKV